MRKTEIRNTELIEHNKDYIEKIGITKNKKRAYNITEAAAEALLCVEERLIKNKKDMCEALMMFAKDLYHARKILKSGRGEGFLRWIHDCGMKKSTVYKYLEKYEYYLKFKTLEVFMLTEKNIKSLKMVISSETFSEEDITSMIVSNHKIRSYELDKVALFLERKQIINENERMILLGYFVDKNIESLEEEFSTLSRAHKSITNKKKELEKRMTYIRSELDKKKALESVC